MRTPRGRSKSNQATAPSSPAIPARSSSGADRVDGPAAPPTELTFSRPLSETLGLTEKLGRKKIPADPTDPEAVQQQWDEQELQQAKQAAEKAEARAVRFSGRHQEPGDLRQELAKIVQSPEYQDKPWKSIMREVARRLDDGRVVGDRLYYRDSSLGALDIGSAAFQAKLSTARRAEKKS